MPHYVCYCLDSHGHMRERLIIEAVDDTEAIGKAQRYLAKHLAIPKIELWQGTRCIGKYTQAENGPWLSSDRR
jgi:hypothetical protein